MEKNGKLYGRGAYDTKAGAAAMIHAFKDLAKQVSYPLGLQLVTDEETGGFSGTKYQLEKGVLCDFILCADASNFEIVNNAKGILWIEITANGVSAHAAYPWKGKNAVSSLLEYLSVLKKVFQTSKKNTWTTTINISAITTDNTTFNKVPDHATAKLDIRYIPGDKDRVLREIRKILPKSMTMKIIVDEPHQQTPATNPYILQLQKVAKDTSKISLKMRNAHGGSDVRFYNAKGIDGVVFGPKGENHHADNEWVDIKNLGYYCKILKEFLLSLN